MNVKLKIVVAILPFGMAAAIGASLAAPAYDEYTLKAEQVAAKKAEQEDMSAKLAGQAKLQKQKKEIEASVAILRENVPKKPELEILNIDIEKMCTESNLDMVAFGEPNKEALKKAGLDEEENAANAKKKIQAAAKTAGAAAATSGAAVTAAAGSATPAAARTGAAAVKTNGLTTADAGLAKVTVQVKCIGDYAGLMDMVKKLETYQRVVTVSSLKATLPKKVTKEGDKEKHPELPDENALTEADVQGDWKKMNISFLLTAYYLP